MGKRVVYLKEFDTFGEEVDVKVTCNNWNAFLRVWDIETLQLIMDTQIQNENYEAAGLIKEHIERKGA